MGELGSEKNDPKVTSEEPASVHFGPVHARRTMKKQGTLGPGNTVNRLEAKIEEQ